MLYRLDIPYGKGYQSVNIFQKLYDSVILYCDFLVEEHVFEVKDVYISKYRTDRYYKLINFNYQILPDDIIYNLKAQKLNKKV